MTPLEEITLVITAGFLFMFCTLGLYVNLVACLVSR
jgi:hypothetical protein